MVNPTNSMPNAFPAFNQTTSPLFVKSGTNGSRYVLILDESGSMASVHSDTIGGVNALIDSQKSDPIVPVMEIVKFEGGNINTIRKGLASNLEPLTVKDYRPSGGTNLLDAIGDTIISVNTELSQMYSEETRPSVIFQITTDGEENSSRRFTIAHIKNMISQATSAGWMFTFVGADVDAFQIANSLGINASGVSNFKKGNMAKTFVAMGSSATRMRSAMSTGTSANELYASAAVYTADEKKDMEE